MRKLIRWFSLALMTILTDVPTIDGNRFGNMRLEGALSKHHVMIGSHVNITCRVTSPPCAAYWVKNTKLVNETNEGRVEWLHGKQLTADQCTTNKLMIKKFHLTDEGKYTCFTMTPVKSALPISSQAIQVYAVQCYHGFYCPSNSTKPKRCPTGTFSIHNNATSVKECQPCPTHNSRDELKKGLETKLSDIFDSNCPVERLTMQDDVKKLSREIKIVIVVISLLIAITLVTAVPIFIIRRKRSSMKNIFSAFKDVEYDPPNVPRSRDVFVCYSSKNKNWVHMTLMPKLQSQHFKVFIDFVDFEIGRTIDDNMIKGIYESRKTLFVLSKDSLKSLYARKELYHALAAGKTGHQVLVIMYEQCQAPAAIANVVYLDWTDVMTRDKFWERLFNAIRRPLANETVNV